MGWQLRLRHALGEAVFELTPRTVDRPITIGRSSDADVQVPTLSVAMVHCAVFVHDGRWIIENAAPEAATFVNGASVRQPSCLNPGDIIRLGPDENAPQIVLAYVPDEVMSAATTASAATSVWGEAALAPAGESPPTEPGGGLEAADLDAAAHAALSKARGHYYVPRQPVARAVFVWAAVGTVVVAAGAFLFLRHLSRRATLLPPVPAVKAPSAEKKATTRAVIEASPHSPRAADPAPLTTPAPPRPADPKADLADDADWQAIQAAVGTQQPAQALALIDRYTRGHPNTPLAGDLARLQDHALDSLYWMYVRDLCEARDEAIGRIDKLKAQIRSEPEEQYKTKTLEPQLRKAESSLERFNELLADAGYTAKRTPNLLDEDQLNALRADRPADKYAPWKRQMADKVLRKHGQIPWSFK